jgi:hypothetical protein
MLATVLRGQYLKEHTVYIISMNPATQMCECELSADVDEHGYLSIPGNIVSISRDDLQLWIQVDSVNPTVVSAYQPGIPLESPYEV